MINPSYYYYYYCYYYYCYYYYCYYYYHYETSTPKGLPLKANPQSRRYFDQDIQVALWRISFDWVHLQRSTLKQFAQNEYHVSLVPLTLPIQILHRYILKNCLYCRCQVLCVFVLTYF